jgi:hypothetical protein
VAPASTLAVLAPRGRPVGGLVRSRVRVSRGRCPSAGPRAPPATATARRQQHAGGRGQRPSSQVQVKRNRSLENESRKPRRSRREPGRTGCRAQSRAGSIGGVQRVYKGHHRAGGGGPRRRLRSDVDDDRGAGGGAAGGDPARHPDQPGDGQDVRGAPAVQRVPAAGQVEAVPVGTTVRPKPSTRPRPSSSTCWSAYRYGGAWTG